MTVVAGLWRRLAAFVYEGLLLFGVVMLAGFIYGTLTQQRHALQGQTGLKIFVFLVLGAYFVWFWSRHGQTLAMRTWRLRLVRADGAGIGWVRACCRYVLAWLWFLPAWAAQAAAGLQGAGVTFGMMLTGILAYVLVARFLPDRQFLHDWICGTCIIDNPPQPQVTIPS